MWNPLAGTGRRKMRILAKRRRASGIVGTITHANKLIAAKTKAPTSRLRPSGINRPSVSPIVGRETSRTCGGAKAVAGVAEAAATTGAAEAFSTLVFVCATAGPSRSLTDSVDATTEADGAAATGVVSTVGENAGTGRPGRSSGLAGVPAALDPLEVTTGASAVTAGDSTRDAGASAAATAGLGAGEASFAFACLLAATVVPGIGLGSIAGLDSVCADMTAAASAAGAGEPAKAGLCIQPRS